MSSMTGFPRERSHKPNSGCATHFVWGIQESQRGPRVVRNTYIHGHECPTQNDSRHDRPVEGDNLTGSRALGTGFEVGQQEGGSVV